METTADGLVPDKKKPVPPRKGRTAGVPQVKRPKRLIDMQYVYKTDKPGKEFPGDTPACASCRTYLREDLKGFLSLLTTMEKEYTARRERVLSRQVSAATGEIEQGTKDLVAVIDRLFNEFEGEAGE